jgi:hypothetical protein
MILLIVTKSPKHVEPSSITFNAEKSLAVMQDMHLEAINPYYPSSTTSRNNQKHKNRVQVD